MSKERDREKRPSRSGSPSTSLSKSRSLSRSKSRSRSPSIPHSNHSLSRSREYRSSSRYHRSSHRSSIDPAFRDTNSDDPRAIAARIFVGNIPTELVTKEDIIDIFSEYGRVTAVTLLKGYGFIQFSSPDEARAAVDGRNQTFIKDNKIDVKMAFEGRKKHFHHREPYNREWDRRPPDRFREGGGYGRRSPPPRDPYDDPYRRPPPERDPYRRDPYEREPYPERDPYARDPYPPPRDPRDARDPYARDPRDPRDRLPPPPPHDPYARDPYPPERREPLPPPARDPYTRPGYPPPPAVRALPPPSNVPDCEIIVLNAEQREYANGVELRLKSRSMLTSVNILPGEEYLARATDDVLRRGLPYNIVISAENEKHRSITLKILHGTPQEHRNMPLDDALSLVARNFEELTKTRRQKDPQEEKFKLPDQEISYYLHLAADNRFLRIDELNKVIRYLTERRDALIVKEGGIAPGRANDANGVPSEAALDKQQQELQSKILSVLGDAAAASRAAGSSATVVTPALAAVGAYMDYSNAKPAASSVADVVKTPTIDLNNPSVQQALNSLISSGGNFLANISQAPLSVASSSLSRAPSVSSAQYPYQYSLGYPRI